MFNKKLKEELYDAVEDRNYYRAKLLKIIDVVRTDEELENNPYTTVRKIKDIIYSEREGI